MAPQGPAYRPAGPGARWVVGAACAVAAAEIGAAVLAFRASEEYVAAARSGTDVSSIITAYDVSAVPTFGLLLLTYVLTCLWLQQARENAIALNPAQTHSYSNGWIWGGWVVPIVSLWFPYRIVHDVHRATRAGGASPTLLPLWWAAWLAYFVTTQVATALVPWSGTPAVGAARALGVVETINAAFCVVALVAWIVIVRSVGHDQERVAAERAAEVPAAAPLDWPPSEYGFPSSAEPNPPSNAMAIWALVLAVLPIPLTWLVAIGLAVAVLVQSKDGREHGQGAAIAALVIAPLWIVVAIGLVVLGVTLETEPERDPAASSAPDESSRTRQGEVSIFDLKKGDCLPKETSEELVTTVELVSCSKPHAEEVYAVFALAEGPYPGDKRVARVGERGCLSRFKRFVGLPYDESRLEFTFYYPTADAWAEDRNVSCLVLDSSLTTGSLEGSGR